MKQKGIYIPYAPINVLTIHVVCDKNIATNYPEGIMAKKIAVVVRDRQDEALRMAVGLTLADDEVNVFVMDRKLASNEANDLNVETLGDMDAKVFTNNPENKFEQKTTDEIASALAGYDVVIAY